MADLPKLTKSFLDRGEKVEDNWFWMSEMPELAKLTKSFLDRGEKCHTLTHAIRVGDYYSVIIFFQHGVELYINHSSKKYHNVVLFTTYRVSKILFVSRTWVSKYDPQPDTYHKSVRLSQRGNLFSSIMFGFSRGGYSRAQLEAV